MATSTDTVTQRIVNDEAARLARYANGWRAYHANLPKPLHVRRGQPDDNVPVPLARTLIDKGVSFLFGKGGDTGLEVKVRPDLADDAGDADEPSVADAALLARADAAEDYLESVFGRRWQTFLTKLGQNGGICGHAFVKIVTTGGDAIAYPPRLVPLDPANVCVHYDGDDLEDVWRYVIEYAAEVRKGDMSVPMERRQLIDRVDATEGQLEGRTWRIENQERRPGKQGWATSSTVEWPYEFAPIADCQNLPLANEYYGMSDLDGGVLKLLEGLTFVASNLNRVVRINAHPQTWASGLVGTDPIDRDPERIIKLPDGAELHNLEGIGSLEIAVRWFGELKGLWHEAARLPEVATGKLDKTGGTLSGRALAILYGPLVELTDDKRLTYGELILDLGERLLKLGGFDLEGLELELIWPEVVPQDAKEEAEILTAEVALGVSTDTALRKLGYDPDVEARLKAADSAALGSALLDGFNAGTMDGPNPPPAQPPPGGPAPGDPGVPVAGHTRMPPGMGPQQ